MACIEREYRHLRPTCLLILLACVVSPARGLDFTSPLTLPLGGAGAGTTITGDFDGDGQADLATAPSYMNEVFQNGINLSFGDGSGAFPDNSSFLAGFGVSDVSSGDFNGDGIPDLATPEAIADPAAFPPCQSPFAEVPIHLGIGDGTFIFRRCLRAGDNPRVAASGDFNGDGKDDLIVINNPGANAYLFLGDGTGDFTLGSTFLTGAGTDIAVNDFNGDGNLDIVVASGFAYPILGNGDGTFSARAQSVTGAAISVAVGDVDGDGNADIVAAGSDPIVWVARGRGDGTFISPQSYTAGPGVHAVTVADLDLDGRGDILASNSDSNDVSILLADPNGGFYNDQRVVSTGTQPSAVTTADFNEDGLPDIAITNHNSAGDDGSISILLQRSGGPVARDDLATLSEDSSITINLTANDVGSTSPVDPSTVTLTSAPLNGNVTLSLDGLALYQPNADFNGSDTFTYTASDQRGTVTNTARVHITVMPVNDPPMPDATPIVTDEDTAAISQVYVNDPDTLDADPDTHVYAIAGAPSNGTASISPLGLISYAPDTDFNGSDQLIVTVTDRAGASSSIGVPITVRSVNDPPIAVDDTASTDQDVAVTLAVLNNDSDVDGSIDASNLALQSLPANGTATVDAAGAVVYVPAAGFSGHDAFTYTVFDNLGAESNAATVAITVAAVNHPPAPSAPTVTVSQDGTTSVQVAANDPDPGDNHQYAISSPPANGTATISQSGLLSYSPKAGFSGPDALTITVTDSASATGSVIVSITVVAANQPPITVNDTATTNEDAPVTFSILANDSDPNGTLDAASVTIVRQPNNGALLNNGDGTVSYSPAPDFFGTDAFTYTVSDDEGAVSNWTNAFITVAAVNDPPVANDVLAVLDEDSVATGRLSATDTDGDSLSYRIVSGANKGSVVVTDSLNGSFTYTPHPNAVGTDSFTFQANDGSSDSNLATATITIQAVNDAPAPTAPAIATSRNTAASVQILNHDPDVGDSHTYAVTTPPANGSASVSAGGLVTYLPDAGFSGSDRFSVTVTDAAGAFGSVQIPVTVAFVNDPPVASDDVATTPEDTAVVIPVVANDHDTDGTIDPASLAIVIMPTNGTAIVNADGSIGYNPAANFHGNDLLTYSVRDNDGATSNARVTITITAVNDPPVANDDTAGTPEGAPVTISLTANDTDVDGTVATSTVAIVNQPSNGAVVLNGDGTATYSPNPLFNGTDGFSYTVADDGNARSNTALVTVTINAVNQAPVAASTNLTTREDTVTLGQFEATDADADALVYRIVANGSLGTLTLTDSATGAFTYTPKANLYGTDSISFQVSDGTTDSNVASVSIILEPVNDAPAPSAPAIDTLESTAGSSQITANDPDPDDTFSYAIATAPAHGTVSVSGTGLVTYVPAVGFWGTDQLAITVSDAEGAIGTVAISVRVGPVNDPPVANDDAATTNENTTISVPVLANDVDPDGVLDLGSVVIGTGPASGTAALNVGGTISYTPSAGFIGTDGFNYTVRDNEGAESNTATVTVTVNAVNQVPIANDDSASTTEGAIVTIQVTANDTDADGNLVTSSVLIVQAPANGTASYVADGNITYMPNSGFSGIDQFAYTVADDDGLRSEVATVTVTVSPASHAPIALDGALTTKEDEPADGRVAVSDPDGDALSYRIVTQPGNGTVKFTNAIGAFRYEPHQNASGTDTFAFQANDGVADSNVATIVVTIVAVNDAPAPTAPAINIPEDSTGTAQIQVNDPDDGDTHVFAISSNPTRGTATVSETGLIRYIPDSNYFGTDEIAVRATDGSGAYGEVHVQVSIESVNDAPVAHDDEVSIDQDMSIDIDVTANDDDPDGSMHKPELTIVTEPGRGTAVVHANGKVRYTPVPDFDLVDQFTYRIIDELGAQSGIATVVVTVDTDRDGIPDGLEPGDNDGDGVGDPLEPGSAANTATELEFVVPKKVATMLAAPELAHELIRLTSEPGTALFAIADTRGLPIYTEEEMEADLAYRFPFGLLDFEVAVPNGVARITITLPDSAVIPADAVFRKKDINGIWRTVPDTEFSADRHSLTVTLYDNDTLDLNPEPGVVRDPGGIAVERPVTGASAGGGGGAGPLLTLLLIGMQLAERARNRRRDSPPTPNRSQTATGWKD